MRNAAVKLIIFISGGLLLLAPICLAVRQVDRSGLADQVFFLPREVTTLVAGDSHTETAVDPSLLPHSVNIASSGENYFYTYYKLKHILEKNPQIATVVLGCSWHNLPQKYQDSFLSGDIPSSIEKYFPLLDGEGRSALRSWKTSYLVPALRYQLGVPLKGYADPVLTRKLAGLDLRRVDFSFYGSYRALEKCALTEERTARKITDYFSTDDGAPSKLSPRMVEYLEKIVKLCTSRKVAVVLVNTPVYRGYQEKVPVAVRRYFDQTMTALLQKNSSVSFIDLTALTLPIESYYDGDHVNARGAKAVTRTLSYSLGRLPTTAGGGHSLEDV